MRRSILVVLFVALVTGTAFALGDALRPDASPLVLVVGAERVELNPADYVRADRVDHRALTRAIARRVAAQVVVRSGRARVLRRRDLLGAARQAASLGTGGGVVSIDSRTVSVAISASVVAQAQRNTCESAALQVLAGTVGLQLDQRRIQRAFPTSGRLDPAPGPAGEVWGDPDDGYVGRPDGGGARGGFGIYPGPVLRTARQLGLVLDDLTGASSSAVYRRLLGGRAVMAWIGLSDGPYGTWISPEGRRIRVNFGEHTVVVHGVRADGRLLISNPLRGTREMWTKAEFEERWQRLGRRALSPK